MMKYCDLEYNLSQQQAVSQSVPLQETTAAAEAERDEAQAQLQKAQEQMQELHVRAEGGSVALQQVKQLQEQVSDPLLTAQLALSLLQRRAWCTCCRLVWESRQRPQSAVSAAKKLSSAADTTSGCSWPQGAEVVH